MLEEKQEWKKKRRLLDSVSVLVLVQELEEEFGIEIAAEEITEYNFKNVNSIISMLQNK